jgi:hypothetical protein
MGANHAQGIAIRIALYHHASVQYPEIVAVFTAKAIFFGKMRRFSFDCLLYFRQNPLYVVGMQPV